MNLGGGYFHVFGHDFYLSDIAVSYVWGVAIFFASYMTVQIFKSTLMMIMHQFFAHRRKGIIPIVIQSFARLGKPFSIVASLALATSFVNVPFVVREWSFNAFILVVVVHSIILIEKLMLYALSLLLHRPNSKDEINPGIVNFVNNFAKVVIWIVALVLVLQNFGFNLTALVGGLGIAGVAVAFGLNNILSDIFAYFAINLDQPFKIGDFIVVDGLMGTVKKIGVKTTRITTLDGEELVINNKELSNARIHNYALMRERRVVVKFRIAYGTPLSKLQTIPGFLQATIKSMEKVRFDRAHFAEFGDIGFEFELVYHVVEPDYNLHMDIQQEIGFKLLEHCEAHKIELAFLNPSILANLQERRRSS